MRKAVFLDRDGVINKDPGGGGYVTSWEGFHFLPGAKEAIKKLNENGYEVIIISNQAGVAKGVYTQESLNLITKNMLSEIEESGGKVREALYCPHRDEDNCDCRKPKAGLLIKAARGADINFEHSFFIGDSRRDVEAGKAVGCKTIFVLSGKTNLEELEGWPVQPDAIKSDLLDAANWIIGT